MFRMCQSLYVDCMGYSVNSVCNGKNLYSGATDVVNLHLIIRVIKNFLESLYNGLYRTVSVW